MTATTTKGAVQALQRQVAALEARLVRTENDAAVLRTRVDCYERMLEAVLQGLGLGRATVHVPPLPGFPTISNAPATGGAS